MSGALFFCAGVIVGLLLRPRLSKALDYLKSVRGE